jgi:enoyl-CoA hydratase
MQEKRFLLEEYGNSSSSYAGHVSHFGVSRLCTTSEAIINGACELRETTYDLKESVATITMDDGKLNVMSLQMTRALNEALNQAVADNAVALLTGRPGMFSAGFDLKALSLGGADTKNMVKEGFELAERVLSFAVPVVIACSGHAVAMGVFLLLSGDLRIGAEGPYKIGANEVAIGLTMPHFGIEICRQRLAPAHFNRAAINSEMYSPDQAVAAGFLDHVVLATELLTAAQHAVATLAKLNIAVHTASKLRARAHALKAIRAAIEADASSPSERWNP